MNDFLFFVLLAAFIIMLLKKDEVSLFLFDKLGINIQPKNVMYTSIVLIALLMAYGILFDDTKEKYSGISAEYNKMRPDVVSEEEKNKPHRWFNIDFDTIFPW